VPDPTPTNVVLVELLVAKSHLRNARALAQQQQEPAAACARITIALDATQDAIDYRSEQ
jgi:hypothetical protein